MTRYILIGEEEKPIDEEMNDVGENSHVVQFADFRDKKYPNHIKELLYNHCIRFVI